MIVSSNLFQSQELAKGITIIGMAWGDLTSLIPTRIDFGNDTSLDQQQQAYIDAQSFPWLPDPNQQQFITDCINDSTIPGDFGTIGFINQLASLAFSPLTLQAQWSKSVSNLSPDAQAAIELHATNNNMLLKGN